MKAQTYRRHARLANDAMHYIYLHIDTDVNLDELSHTLGISKFQLHRVFSTEFGESIYQTIQSIRLQKASNLLLTNPLSTISMIASECGYSSQTSFIRAFGQRFHMSPTQWRRGGYEAYSEKILSHIDTDRTFGHLAPVILKMPELKAFYVRHQGYDPTIKSAWQKLRVWMLEHELVPTYQIGLLHDNPIITPLASCRYVAAVVIEEKQLKGIETPNVFTIPAGIYAKFSFEGCYGDVLVFLRWVYHGWLVKSGFETTTAPAYTIYRKNHFLSEDGMFDLDFYLPVRYAG